MTRDRYATYKRDLADGICMTASVSPCVFMNPGYPLQLKICLSKNVEGDLGTAFVIDRGKTAEDFIAADLRRLALRVKTKPCTRCGTPAFDSKTVQTNRDGLCEHCFLQDLNSEYKKEMEVEQSRIAANDERMKNLGMAFRVTAAVHPTEDGDDYMIDRYFAVRPTTTAIQSLIRNEGSEILDDYRVIAL